MVRPMLGIIWQYQQQSACQAWHMVGLSALSSLTGLQMFEDASLGQAGLQRNRQRHSGEQTDLGMDGQAGKKIAEEKIQIPNPKTKRPCAHLDPRLPTCTKSWVDGTYALKDGR